MSNAPPLEEPLPVVPGFRLLRRIGRGGMGEIFQAVRIGPGGFRKPLALKQLLVAQTIDGKAVNRFLREARVSADLEHPNIVRIYDLQVFGRGYFIVMELLRGLNFAELWQGLARSGPVPWPIALSVAEQALSGLAYAHARAGSDGQPLGLVHRDLTPRNLFVCEDGTVKVLDFGIVKLREGATAALTQQGMLPATVSYVSPEQAAGTAVDARSDLFQLGATIYASLTGRSPHGEGGSAEILGRALYGTPEPIRTLRPDLPEPVAALVMRALARNPADRFPDAIRMRDAVREALRAAPESGPSLLAAAVARFPRPELAPADADAPAEETASEPPARPRDATTAVVPKRKADPRVMAFAMGALIALFAFAAGRWLAPHGQKAPGYQLLTFRRGDVRSARFAPDGKSFVLSAAWGSEPLDTFLGVTGSPEARSLGMSGLELLAVSRSGDLALLAGATRTFGFVQVGILAETTLAGGAPRPAIEGVQWADYSPSGQLAVVRWNGDRTRLELPVGKTVYAPEGGWIGSPRISPDGRRIAFVRHPLLFDDRGAIAVLDLASGAVQDLTDVWISAEGLAWSPGGDEVWFTAAPKGITRSLHAVTLRRALRDLAEPPVGLTLEDVAPDGRVLVRRDAIEQRVSGRGRQDWMRDRDFSWFDATYVVDVSADGSSFLLGEGAGDAVAPDNVAYLRKSDGSAAIRLAVGQPRSLSPDGKLAVVITSAQDRLTLVPTGPGDPRELPLHGLQKVVNVAWFPDGTRLLLDVVPDGSHERVWVAPLDGGEPRAIGNLGSSVSVGSNPVSPDGTRVVLVGSSGTLQIAAADGSKDPFPVPGVLPGESEINWADDGRIYVANLKGVPVRVAKLDVTTGTREFAHEILPPDPTGVRGLSSLVMTRDARTYAYTYLRNQSALVQLRTGR